MTHDVGYERRKAVANAWKNEKGLVLGGKGTRDWSQKEQKEIISKGRATGYEGHHMKSVDGHNSKAGDANNIQFLNRKEHLAAHGGDFNNNTNGYYDPKTNTMNSFGRGRASVESKPLSNPLSERQIKSISKNASNSARIDAAKEKAKATEKRPVSKSERNSISESKTLNNQRGTASTTHSDTGYKSKTLAAQKSTASEASRGPTKSQVHKNKH